MYTNRRNPRASVLECCSPLQLSRTPVTPRTERSIARISPHNPLISRVLTPLNLNKEFFSGRLVLSLLHNNSHIARTITLPKNSLQVADHQQQVTVYLQNLARKFFRIRTLTLRPRSQLDGQMTLSPSLLFSICYLLFGICLHPLYFPRSSASDRRLNCL